MNDSVSFLSSSARNRNKNSRSEFEASFEMQEETDDENISRKNETAFKYMGVFHAQLAEKAYSELCSLAFGEFEIEGGSVSPLMWTRLYEIFAETEIQTRKLPTESSYAKKSAKYTSEAVQVSSVMAIFTALPHEYSDTRDVSLLSQLIADDLEFRRIFALLLWSEKAISEQQYEKGITGGVKKFERLRTSRGSSIMELKRTKFGGNAPKTASVDPDERGTDEDAETEQAAKILMFQLIRAGEIAKATELAMNLGMGALAAQFQLHSMLRNPTDLPLELNSDNQAACKRIRRAKYFTMIQRLIENAKKNEDDAHLLLLNALRGNLKPMLKAANTVAERVWAYANSAFLARILVAEGALKEDEVLTLFNVPITAGSILGEMKKDSSMTKEVLILFRVLDAMLYDEIDDLFELARSEVEGYIPQELNCDVNVVALDFFFHLVGISLLSGFERNPDAEVVIRAQFDDLRHRVGTASHKRMAAFYSRFLPEESKVEQIVETMKLVDTEKERIIFVESLKQCEIDFGDCASVLIKNIRNNDSLRMIELKEQIEHWQWLLVGGEETALAAVEEMNRLIRKCLLQSNLDELTIRKIFRESLSYELPQLLSNAVLAGIDHISLNNENEGQVLNSVEHSMNEILAHCTFMDLFNFIVTIALKLDIPLKYEPIMEDELRAIGGVKTNDFDFEASLRVRARAELTLREEAAKRKSIDIRARREMVKQHMENAFPLLKSLLTNIGWRGEFFLAPNENGDPLRSVRNELDVVRNKFVPMFFTVFAKAAYQLGDMLTFIDFFSSFDPDSGDLGIDADHISALYRVIADLNMNEK